MCLLRWIMRCFYLDESIQRKVYTTYFQGQVKTCQQNYRQYLDNQWCYRGFERYANFPGSKSLRVQGRAQIILFEIVLLGKRNVFSSFLGIFFLHCLYLPLPPPNTHNLHPRSRRQIVVSSSTSTNFPDVVIKELTGKVQYLLWNEIVTLKRVLDSSVIR